LGIATSLNNIGNIYENQGDMINAIDYYLKSIIVRTMCKCLLSLYYGKRNN